MVAPAAAQAANQKMVIPKSEAEYNMKSIRFLLLTITSMFIVTGILMMVMGISVYSRYHSFSFLHESAYSSRFLTPSILFVFLGFMLAVLSSFGVFGSIKQSTCMINLYALILLVIMLLKMIVVILCFTPIGQTVLDHLSIPLWLYGVEPEIEAEIDFMQNTLSCCGDDSHRDYRGVVFNEHQSTVMINEHINGEESFLVPRSCCGINVNPSEAVARNGCRIALVNTVLLNSTLLGVLGASVMFIELLGIIFALLLARCIRKLKSEKAMLAWTIREQVILGQQENSMYIAPEKSSKA